MSKSNETGHAKNVANFGTVITYTKGYGNEYNPSNPEIAIPKLEAAYDSAGKVMKKINVLDGVYGKTVEERKIAFTPLSKLSTKIVNSFMACKPSQQAIDNAESAARKLKGGRAGKKEEATAENLAAGKKSISVSQMSFDNRINNLDILIQILKLEPKYKPNETELQVTSLEALHADLTQKNNAARDAEEPLSNARLERDQLLYAETGSLLSLAADVKKYVSSVYGTTGPKYKQISGISFKRPKED